MMLASTFFISCCLSVLYQCKRTNSFSWGLDMTPSCVPVNLLCAYTEECCAGVCIQRTYFRIIKIKQCTLGNDLPGLPPESQLNYFQTAEQTKNLTRLRERLQLIEEHNAMYPDDSRQTPSLEFTKNIRPEVKKMFENEKTTLDHGMKEEEPNFINIYKPVVAHLFTTPRPEEILHSQKFNEILKADPGELEKLKEKMKNVSLNRVSKDSKMYGGPLNLTGIFRMPSDNLHKTLLHQTERSEGKQNETVGDQYKLINEENTQNCTQ